MKRLICNITIGNFQFDYCHDLTIFQDWDKFTDTARILMPNKFRRTQIVNKNIIAGTTNLFKRGDAVSIKIGYFPILVEKFKGFISKVRADSPMILECEDQMFLLKQVNLKTRLFTNPTIKEVVEYATASQAGLVIEFDDETAKIGDFHVENKGFINAVTVFEVLKKQFGYNIYFENGTLQVRVLKSILSLNRPVHDMGMQFNVISDTMEFQRDDDTDQMVRFESKQDDNSVLLFFGTKVDGQTVINNTAKFAGVTHSWTVPDLTEAQIKKIINDNIDKYIWEGIKGSIVTFLEPSVVVSDKIKIIDFKNRDNEGTFLIKSVETGFGINGGRQTIQLRNKITA